MVGTGNWSKNDVFTASKWNKGHDAKFQTLIKRKNRGEIWNNRRQSAEQWRKENETLYEIAKHYHVCPQTLSDINQCSGDALEQAKRLLVPRGM